MTTQLNVGLIGCGFIGRFHSRNVRAVARTERLPVRYVAVCDREIERANAFARIAGCERTTTRAQDLIDDPDINVIYVTTETSEHTALVKAAVARGKHVFCEKPLARTLAEVEELVSAVETAGVTHQVGLVLRFSPVFRVIEDLIQSADLGPLLTAHLRDDQFFPVRGHYASAWRGDYAKAGGGALIEHSIHDLDLFRRLFGEITRVRCQRRFTTGHPGVEDLALVRFDHAHGHQTTLSSIWHGIDERPSTRRLEIFFEGGWFATNHDFIGPITYQLRTGAERTMEDAEVMRRYAELEGLSTEETDLAARGVLSDLRFLEAAAAGRQAHPSFRPALAAHRVVDACYRSADSDSDIEIPPTEEP